MTEIPDEFKGVRVDLLEQNIRRLQNDMEAEIQTIKMRYTDKIEYMKSVLSLAQRQ
jgi:phage host-nuclease inhibitor protein Gam